MSTNCLNKANFTGKFLSLALLSCCAVNAVYAAPAEKSATNQTEISNLAGSKIDEASAVEGLQTPDGKSYQMTRALVNATPEEVFAIIVDYKNSGKLFANLTKSDVVAHDNEKGTTNVAFSLKGMMNLFSFDYVLSIKETYPTLIEFHRVSGAFKRNEGYWKMIPVDGGRKTEVVYAKYVDAGMIVPPSIVAKQVHDSTASVMANLKQVAENPNQKLASHR